MTTAELTEQATTKYAQTSWIRIHYNEAGTGDPPVVFLHGSGPGASSWSNFARNVAPISSHFRCLLMDQPGYGKTDSWTMTEPRNTVNARAVKDLIDVLGIERVSLVGNSMGGGTALCFAVDYPERLHKMVLMGSGGAGTSLFAVTPSEGIKVLNETFDNPSVEQFRKLINVMLYDGASVPDQILKERYETTVGNPGHIEARKNSVNVQRNLALDLPNIKAETLIIHGRNDRVVPLEGSLALLSAIPNSSLHVFNRCGHWAQYEHADEFNRLVIDFLTH
jgi:2-hydroxy-6-oxonona-2,4-dienedioate hydrolase